MIPFLILYADALGILGSWAGANIKGDVSFVLFFSQAFSHVDFIDFIPAVIKSFFFGAVIGLVGCYKGYNAGRGTESVGLPQIQPCVSITAGDNCRYDCSANYRYADINEKDKRNNTNKDTDISISKMNQLLK